MTTKWLPFMVVRRSIRQDRWVQRLGVTVRNRGGLVRPPAFRYAPARQGYAPAVQFVWLGWGWWGKP